MAFDIVHSTVDLLGLAPGLRQLRQHRYDRRFFDPSVLMNLFRGVYESFEAAFEAIPADRRLGYDNDEAAELYTTWLEVFDYDYPALFWIQRSLADGMRRVFDLGGNIGIKYYAFEKLQAFPADMTWTVGDLPAIVRKGREFEREHDSKGRLSFTDQISELDGCDILFASGSLQYLPRTLSEMLSGLKGKPRRVVINITAIHPDCSYFTVNHIGPGLCAYRVQQHEVFVQSMLDIGYVLLREWKNHGKSLQMPFNPGYSLQYYSGFCFDLAPQVATAQGLD